MAESDRGGSGGGCLPRGFPARRVDVIDATFRVCLRGSDISDLEPVSGILLENELLVELSATIGSHDFKKRAVACGLLGDSHSWRVVVMPQSAHYLVLLERSDAGRKIALYARRHMLEEDEAEFLRFVIGGYTIDTVARRSGDSPVRIKRRKKQLLRRLRGTSFAGLVYEIIAKDVLAQVVMAAN
jgi:hypothetical protein